MLRAIGVPSLDALIDQTIPSGIRFSKGLNLPPAETEAAYLRRLRTVAAKNKVSRSCIGMGYYDTHTPAVILRNIFENPGWYTPYTPYQAEIAQGRLESLLNFQTMVRDLTGMEIASASLLDEGTAAAEAMTMFHRLNTKKAPAGQETVFLVSARTFPQTIDVLKGRAEPLGIRLEIGDPDALPMDRAFGLLLQYPDDHGEVRDLRAVDREGARRRPARGRRQRPDGADAARRRRARWAPTPWSATRSASACRSATAARTRRSSPRASRSCARRRGGSSASRSTRAAIARIAWRCRRASSTSAARRRPRTSAPRRRSSPTSPRCTRCSTGPKGLRAIGERIHGMARAVEDALAAAGLRQTNAAYFDTLQHRGGQRGAPSARPPSRPASTSATSTTARSASRSTRRPPSRTSTDIVKTFAAGSKPIVQGRRAVRRSRRRVHLRRQSEYLTHPVFNTHHSETEMMRYIRSLERKDVGLDTSMIPLGSCTMKLNAAAEMLPVTWPEFSRMHPVRAGRPGAGLCRGLPRSRGGAVRDHRVCRHVAAAQLRRAGGVRRA